MRDRQRVFDTTPMEDIAGCRAAWKLYKLGRWTYLEDFGLDRTVAEPLLLQFESEEIVGDKLTKAQCRRLMRLVPGLNNVSVEMRLAYVLQNSALVKWVEKELEID